MNPVLYKPLDHSGHSRSRTSPASLFCAAIGLLFLSACAAVGPDYRPEEPSAAADWHNELAGGVTAAASQADIDHHWWQVFDDPQLSALVATAVDGNFDLRMALLRIEEARALLGLSAADHYPVLDGSAQAIRSRSAIDPGAGRANSIFRAGFDAAWELDLFGGVRRSVEAAEADLQARQENLNHVLITMQAEIAVNYLDVRTFQARLLAAHKNLQAQEETYQLNLSLNQAGLIDELAVHQAGYNLEQTRSQIPLLQSGLENAMNRLTTLIGSLPGTLHDELRDMRPIPPIPVSIAIGIPGDTLRQRPDIRQAERELARQSALVGVATAELYPRFRLGGSFGLEALSAEDFFASSSRFWNFGPHISWRLFDAGRVRRGIVIQSLRQEEALLHYQHVVLQAQEEIENALSAFAKEQLRRDSLEKATAAARQADLISRDKYQAGLVDFSHVLDAQRSLLAFEDQLAQSRGTVTTNLIRLYKALGGGWQTRTDSMTYR